MSTIDEIYSKLLLGKALTIQLDGATEQAQYHAFETLRTALCRKNSVHVGLEITDKSIVARFDAQKATGTFRLDWPARKLNASKWTIVAESEEADSNTHS